MVGRKRMTTRTATPESVATNVCNCRTGLADGARHWVSWWRAIGKANRSVFAGKTQPPHALEGLEVVGSDFNCPIALERDDDAVLRHAGLDHFRPLWQGLQYLERRLRLF